MTPNTIKLSPQEQERFIRFLETPIEPTCSMLEALDLHKKYMANKMRLNSRNEEN